MSPETLVRLLIVVQLLKVPSDMAFGGKPTKWDCFITVGVEMMFALSLVGLNSSGPKLIKNPLCLLAAGAAYCGYFVIYKQHKPQYEYSPYHNYLEQYML